MNVLSFYYMMLKNAKKTIWTLLSTTNKKISSANINNNSWSRRDYGTLDCKSKNSKQNGRFYRMDIWISTRKIRNIMDNVPILNFTKSPNLYRFQISQLSIYYVSIYLSFFLSICFSIYVYLNICIYICINVHQCIYQFFYLVIYLTISLSPTYAKRWSRTAYIFKYIQ